MSSSMENDLLCGKKMKPLPPIVKELSSGDSGNMEYQLLIWEVYSLNFERLEKPLRKEKLGWRTNQDEDGKEQKKSRLWSQKSQDCGTSNGWNKVQRSYWLLKNKNTTQEGRQQHTSLRRKIQWAITCNILSINSTLPSWTSYTSLSVTVTF